jgi:hypothetical protein
MYAQALPAASDFNQDGVIDAADYVVWRKNDGTQGGYTTWRVNFGKFAGIGANSSVPEPATAVLLMLTSLGWCLRQTRGA